MGNVIGVLGIFVLMVLFIYCLSCIYALFKKAVSGEDGKWNLAFRTVLSIVIVVLLYQLMMGFPEFFEFKINEPASSRLNN